jgi:branched-chain amino acid transport system permease protein
MTRLASNLVSTPAAWAGLAAVALLAALPLLAGPFVVSLAIACLMYVGLAVSWSLFSGPSGIVSLAGAAFFGLGAYCTAWGLPALPWLAAVAAGAAAAAAYAALIGVVTLRLRGAQFAVITFGLGELTRHAVTLVEKARFGTVGRVIAEAPDDRVVYWTVLATALLALLAYRVVGASRLGLALRGIGADELRAATLGVDPRVARVAGFAISAAFAGALGAAMAARWTYVDPRTVFNPFIVFQTVMVAMVGGPSRLRGPVLGAVGLTLAAELLRLRLPYLYLVALGVLLVVSVLFLPEGLSGLWRPDAPAARRAPAGDGRSPGALRARLRPGARHG